MPSRLEGGQPASSSPSFRTKAFSELFANVASSQTSQVQATMSTHMGEPAVVFKAADMSAVASQFRFILVGKFSKGRPALLELRKLFNTLDLKDTVTGGHLDGRHVLITLNNEADFLRVWSRSIWYIYGCPMRVFKWTPKFHVDRESSLVPV